MAKQGNRGGKGAKKNAARGGGLGRGNAARGAANARAGYFGPFAKGAAGGRARRKAARAYYQNPKTADTATRGARGGPIAAGGHD